MPSPGRYQCLVSVPATGRTICHFRVVRGNGDGFSAFVAYFVKKWASGVRVCGTLDPQAMISWSYTSRQIPVRRFARPRSWRGRRQVAIPVVEA